MLGEQDFLGYLRTVTTAQTYALALPVNITILGYDDRTYGKVAAGFSLEFNAIVNGSATLQRASRRHHT